MKKTAILSLTLLLLSACSYYPECADKDVLDLVVEVCLEELTIELAYNKFYNDEVKELEEELQSSGGRMAMGMLEIMAMMAGESLPDLEEQIKITKRDAKREFGRIVRGAESYDQKYVPYLEHAKQLISKSNIVLVNIRMFAVDKELKYCECAADVIITGSINHEFGVEYTAEITLDDVLLVEVYY